MSSEGIFVCGFFGTMCVLLYVFYFWLRSKRGGRWLEGEEGSEGK